jgi:signal transduction histidine kinase
MRRYTGSYLLRSKLVYALLAVLWLIVAAWQIAEHNRVRHAAQIALRNRSKDITSILGLVVRSQRFRGGPLFQERLESALKELVRSGEVSSIALLNAQSDVIVSAGEPITNEIKRVMQAAPPELWQPKRLLVGNPVDLGASVTPREGETNAPTIVLPPKEERDRARTNNPAMLSETNRPPPPPDGTNRPPRDRGERGGPRFGRPPWMSEVEYRELLQQRGLHGLVLAMSTEPFLNATEQDWGLRAMIIAFATAAVFGLGLAWRNVAATNELEMRLLRASEMNTHLQELSLAAAGLAHETRNPLNIISGLAQMISKQTDASPETRKKSKEIIAETDRVTVQLNEFINYSRPREVRPAIVSLGEVVGEVSRALQFDLEEKMLRLRVQEKLPAIQADEQLLRQCLFNLLLNAVQAADRGGEIEVASFRENGRGAVIEIRDNGPGVPPEQRQEIFKPYFTTHQKGTGLGLAVVQQIVLAHGWEITCLANEPRGAIFRISHVKLAPA